MIKMIISIAAGAEFAWFIKWLSIPSKPNKEKGDEIFHYTDE